MTTPSARPSDGELDELIGAQIASEVNANVSYRVVSRIGDGAMAVAFYAVRATEEGERAVVLKILRPSFVQQAGATAALTIKKEAIALGRLDERVPPTPFVVRFIDTGVLRMGAGPRNELPWVVVEHVYGGAEGTTLTERVEHSIRSTGSAFDPPRAAHAIAALAEGLGAVHEVGVIHRDIKPDNVLCCGFGSDELFKIADFGVARPAGIATFHGFTVGTLGYVAPELLTADPAAVGPWSDIFSFAAVVFHLLTGEQLFQARNPAEALVMAATGTRRSVRDGLYLSPELRARELTCRAIDYAIAQATSAKISERPQTADALGQLLLPWLRVESQRENLLHKRLDLLRDEEPIVSTRERWRWTKVRSQLEGRVLRSVAWDGDGTCLAATNTGLSFWNGEVWSDASVEGYPHPAGVRFVTRIGAGEWLIGGDSSTFATYTTEGVSDLRTIEGDPVRFDRWSGDLDDLAVLVGSARDRPPTLHALVGRKRWLKPFPLEGVAALAGLARVEDARWLLVGRRLDGRGFAAVYSPCEWSIEWLEVPEVRAYISCAGNWDQQIGVGVGASGAVVWRDRHLVVHESVGGDWDLSTAAVDPSGRAWAATAGKIFLRRPEMHSTGSMGQWEIVWTDPSWSIPIVSLFAGLGLVIGLTPAGGIVEGRLTLQRPHRA